MATAKAAHENFHTKPFSLKTCEKCGSLFYVEKKGRHCINCNPQYAFSNKRVLLTEKQIMEIWELQWAMMDLNLLKANRIDVETEKAERREREETIARIKAKYEKAVLGETIPSTATVVHVG
jgi:hypothetical protein